MGQLKQQAIAEGYFDNHDCHLSPEEGCEACQQNADEELLLRREFGPLLFVMKEIKKVVPF